MSSVSPAVSVIIPAYKVTECIGEALESLRRQTFRDFEAIVVNDACPDTANLEQALGPYRSEIIYIKHEKNSGVSAARNTAIRAARAPLVATLDSDDVWEPDYLETQLRLLQLHPDVDVVCPDAIMIGDTPSAGKTIRQIFPSRGEVTFRGLVARECYVFGSGVTARREVLLRAGLYDPSLRWAEDFDLWLRLAKNGTRFLLHDRPLLRVRSRFDGLSRDPVGMADHVVQVYRKMLADPRLAPEERALLEAGISLEQAHHDYYLGLKALYLRNRDEALQRLTRANRVLRRRKVSLTLFALRVAPGPLFSFIHRRFPSGYSFRH